MTNELNNIELRNNLDKASSAYLKSAQHQPIHWQEWGSQVFDLAKNLDRPILLDIGAVWCHWCHVMDRESYEDDTTASIINEHFVAIKIDRDERPDVDRRYQTFVQALSGGGGWPLTCFLTPEGKLFYGGTYFPPDNKFGKPAFKTVLLNMSASYKEKKGDVLKSASSIFEQISEYEENKIKLGKLNKNSITKILVDIINMFDPVYGGFGKEPKFPSGSAIDLSLLAYKANGDSGDSQYLDIAKITLDKCASGGIHDHLGGGFHRYSVDQYWHVPHFEKMTYDNAEFLNNYIELYHVTDDIRYKNIAEGIIRYYTDEMTDQQNGGFFAHQDADITLEDDGDYFTWTKNEISNHLSKEQEKVFNAYFGISELPHDLHGTPDRNVLYSVKSLSIVAEELNVSIEQAETVLDAAKLKLLKIRSTRQAPYIDRTIFTNYNGMMISAYMKAYKILKDNDLILFTKKTFDFLIDKLFTPDHGFAHSCTGNTVKITGLLVDQVWMAVALLDGFEITGNFRYFNYAVTMADFILENFYDNEYGGFIDRISGDNPSPVMDIKHKPFEDAPTASSNSVVVRFLDRVYLLTGEERYQSASEKTLQTFSGSIERNGLYLASYGTALYYHLNPPPQVIIIDSDTSEQTEKLISAGYSSAQPGVSVYVFNGHNDAHQNLSPLIKSKIAGTNNNRNAVAYVCAGTECSPPTGDPMELVEILRTFGKQDVGLE